LRKPLWSIHSLGNPSFAASSGGFGDPSSRISSETLHQ
jgi:hypothetical protein